MSNQRDNLAGGGRNGSVPAGRGTTTADQNSAPDGARKPESPTKLTKPSWKYIAHKTLREFSDDQCTDLAAALTYYSVLALFPALLARCPCSDCSAKPAKPTNSSGCSPTWAPDRSPTPSRHRWSSSPRTPPPGS